MLARELLPVNGAVESSEGARPGSGVRANPKHGAQTAWAVANSRNMPIKMG